MGGEGVSEAGETVLDNSFRGRGGGVLTMKTDLTSNHRKIPGNLYAVVYMVLSIHMFCKGNTQHMLEGVVGRLMASALTGVYDPLQGQRSRTAFLLGPMTHAVLRPRRAGLSGANTSQAMLCLIVTLGR